MSETTSKSRSTASWFPEETKGLRVQGAAAYSRLGRTFGPLACYTTLHDRRGGPKPLSRRDVR